MQTFHSRVRIGLLILCAATAAAKTVTIELTEAGKTLTPPAAVSPGDTITAKTVPTDTDSTGDKNPPKDPLQVSFCPFTALPAIPVQDLPCKGNAKDSFSVPRDSAVVVYRAATKTGELKRVGILLVGHRKPIYLAFTLRKDQADAPVRLEPAGDPPVLTVDDEPFIVIVNQTTDDIPGEFDLTATTADGKFIDVAPVRPTTSQGKAESVGKAPFYADRVLSFHTRFAGEKIVSYDISGYFTAETSNKTTVTSSDAPDTKPAARPPAQDGAKRQTTTEIVRESSSHKIYSGQLPQIHSLYHYNITTGVVATWLRDSSYSRVLTKLKADDTHPAEYKTEEQRGGGRAMPVLMFSAYLRPFDAQVPWTRKDLLPAPSVGFSLSSPSKDVLFGVTHEIRRHVQLAYGVHYGQVTRLAKTTGIDDPTASSAPATGTVFKPGFYIGATFNIDFIRDLFK